jgi:hypothetical protein
MVRYAVRVGFSREMCALDSRVFTHSFSSLNAPGPTQRAIPTSQSIARQLRKKRGPFPTPVLTQCWHGSE